MTDRERDKLTYRDGERKQRQTDGDKYSRQRQTERNTGSHTE